jgi:hypothetical protein
MRNIVDCWSLLDFVCNRVMRRTNSLEMLNWWLKSMKFNGTIIKYEISKTITVEI